MPETPREKARQAVIADAVRWIGTEIMKKRGHMDPNTFLDDLILGCQRYLVEAEHQDPIVWPDVVPRAEGDEAPDLVAIAREGRERESRSRETRAPEPK